MSTEYWVLALIFAALIAGVGIFGILCAKQWRKHQQAAGRATEAETEPPDRP